LKDNYTDNHSGFIDYKSHNPALWKNRSFVLITVFTGLFRVYHLHVNYCHCDKVSQHESLDWRQPVCAVVEVNWPSLDEVGPVSQHKFAEDAISSGESGRREWVKSVDERSAERIRHVLAM